MKIILVEVAHKMYQSVVCGNFKVLVVLLRLQAG